MDVDNVGEVAGHAGLIAAVLLAARMAFAAERFLIGRTIRIGNRIGAGNLSVLPEVNHVEIPTARYGCAAGMCTMTGDAAYAAGQAWPGGAGGGHRRIFKRHGREISRCEVAARRIITARVLIVT